MCIHESDGMYECMHACVCVCVFAFLFVLAGYGSPGTRVPGAIVLDPEDAFLVSTTRGGVVG